MSRTDDVVVIVVGGELTGGKKWERGPHEDGQGQSYLLKYRRERDREEEHALMLISCLIRRDLVPIYLSQ